MYASRIIPCHKWSVALRMFTNKKTQGKAPVSCCWHLTCMHNKKLECRNTDTGLLLEGPSYDIPVVGRPLLFSTKQGGRHTHVSICIRLHLRACGNAHPRGILLAVAVCFIPCVSVTSRYALAACIRMCTLQMRMMTKGLRQLCKKAVTEQGQKVRLHSRLKLALGSTDHSTSMCAHVFSHCYGSLKYWRSRKEIFPVLT